MVDSPVSQTELGLSAHRAGRFDEAASRYRFVLAENPRNAEALHLLGVLRDAQGSHQEAVRLIEDALAIGETAGYHCNLAMVLGHLGRHWEAVCAARRALSLRPGYPEALNNLGVSLTALDSDEAAIQAFQAAVAARADYGEGWINLGHILRRHDRHEESEASFRRTIALRPGEASGYASLALVLDEQDRPHEALALLDLAIGFRPDDAEARHHRAMLLLRLGRFAQGWAEYDWRFSISQAAGAFRPSPAHTLWRGEPLNGRTILLIPEQGLGDTIQFCRYAPLVAARAASLGGQVCLGAPRPLARLLRSSFPDIAVIAEGEAVPEHTLHCPLLSLPHAFLTTLETVPASIPYLSPPDEALDHWRARLPRTAALRCGIVWAGNAGHPNDRRRSLAFAELAPLWALAGVEWHSLQVGSRAADLGAAPAGQIRDLSPELTDFAETAAAIMQLDVVVTPDTAVAHLAGSLGVPSLVMLSFATDWRWIRGQDSSLWYPGMRLFRQDRSSDWRPVIEAVAAALATSAPTQTKRTALFGSKVP
ncbi:tetratricopeptide repeat protein [Lichenicoccus sp.]|uniref:tetratricopeptide repeat protein n=1 Tax=Lichenicoccus sp. TaxID=2781899 RepID=UPI003D09C34C